MNIFISVLSIYIALKNKAKKVLTTNKEKNKIIY